MKTLPFQTGQEQSSAVPEIVDHLQAGGLLAYPTETVYGLGSALLPEALERLADIKGGRLEKSFLLLIADPAQAPGLRWTAAARALAGAFWPGPLTLALAADTSLYPARVLSAGTVAVRQTSHPGLQRLLATFGAPITSTSANRAGEAPARNVSAVRASLADIATSATFLLLDGGELVDSAPSTLIDCSGAVPRLVRTGAIPLDALKRHVHELRT